jgi:ribosome-associated protein
MRVKLTGIKKARISGEFIRLDALLKFANLAASGGEAKMLISSGEVTLNGESCITRGKKIRNGDIVCLGNTSLFVETTDTRQ